jgi:TadE-like protein
MNASHKPETNTGFRGCHRRGSAPLEMVMVAPILFFCFVLVIQVGNFFIGQAGVTAKARNDAWHKRFSEARSSEYDFDGDAGYVEGTSNEERRVSGLVRAFPNPKSGHRVMGDAWHARKDDTLAAARERAEELNIGWNSEDQIELAKLAGVNSFDNLLSQILSVENMGNMIENMIGQFFKDKLGPLGDLLDEFESGGDDLQNDLEEQKNREREEQEQRISELNGKIEAKKQEISGKKDRVSQINQLLEASEDAEDGDPDKLTEEQIEQLENEKKTIEEVDLPRLEKELEALEKERELRQGWLEELQ